MNKKAPLRIAWCPVCNQGWIEVVKDINTKQLFLYCEECETEWDNPEIVNIAGTGTHDKHGNIEIPTYKEVMNIGWKII